MLPNYLRLALRNLWKKKVYTGINLVGLSIAAAFCMLVYMYMQQEKSFDSFHANSDRLYRLEATSLFDFGDNGKPKKSFFSWLAPKDDGKRNMLTHPYVLADDLKAGIPAIEAVVRAQGNYNTVCWFNGQSYKIEDGAATFIESNFFTVMDFPLLEGNPQSVLSGANNVVIDQNTAKRIFGSQSPIGKVISIPSIQNKLFTVTGVAKDFPVNSSIQYKMLFPLEAHPSHLENTADRSNNHFNYTTLLLAKPNTDKASLQSKITAFATGYFAKTIKEWQEQETDKSKEVKFELFVRPLTAAHYNTAYPWGHYTNVENLYQLALLAIVILLIACVNYVLLSLTNTVSRSQEVGIRKTLGAERKSIVWQFLVETQLLVFTSIVAGIFLCLGSIPLFNSLTGARLEAGFEYWKEYIVAGFGLFILLGVLAGAYPSFVMSGMRPLNMLRKFSSVKISPVLSNSLVVVQYSACVLLIISAIVISKQMKLMNSMQLGFDKEQVMFISNPYDWDDPERKLLAERMSKYASTDPAISEFTAANVKFGNGFNLNGHLINDKREMIFQIPIDFGYFDFMKIPIVKGRNFSRDMPTDSARFELPKEAILEGTSTVKKAIVVNETLYNLLGKPPLDEINQSMGARIIGVCKDYQFFSVMKKIDPAYHMIRSDFGFQYSIVRIKPGQDLPKVIDRIQANFSALTSKRPFEFSFADEEIKKGYEVYLQWLKTINVATLIAVIIAGMGLFGLSALYALNRTKEVGIRKVMGASVSSVFFLLNKNIFRLALISFIIAIPASMYLMKEWLQNFPNRIDLNWIIFLVAGLIGLALAIIAVSYHTVRAARANPVESLKRE
jgi:putative ABC transport system permease protein